MIWLADFHFLRPLWLLALPVTALVFWGVWRALPSVDANAWRAVCDAWLLPHLLVEQQQAYRKWLLLPVIAMLLTILALAGPSWNTLEQPLQQSFTARMIVLDLSLSMDASDYQPSRLQQAKRKVEQILQRSPEHQVGLVVFAGDAFMVTPVSYDVNTILALLPVLDTSLIPLQGSRPDRALEEAVDLLAQTNIRNSEIILICDGFKGQRAIEMATRLRNRGYFVSVLAAGTEEGAPIPLRDGSFQLNLDGQLALPQTDLKGLQAIAEAGGGRFAVMQHGENENDIDELLALDKIGRSAIAVDRDASHWIDEGPWLVLLLLPIAALAFRRGWLLLVVLIVVQLPSQVVYALDWRDFWLRPDQQAARALEQGQAAPSLEQSTDPAWRGSALYRRGDYQAAVQAFGKVQGADGHYNRGNALAKMGQYEEAIAAYDAALQRQASHADALYNRMLVVSLLRQQQRQASQQFQDDAGESGQSRQNPQMDNNTQTSGSNSEVDTEQNQDQNVKQLQTFADRQTPLSQLELDAMNAELEQLQQLQKQGQGQGQSLQEWLQQIEDDPGALLRRKFAYKYRNRRNNRATVRESDAW